MIFFYPASINELSANPVSVNASNCELSVGLNSAAFSEMSVHSQMMIPRVNPVSVKEHDSELSSCPFQSINKILNCLLGQFQSMSLIMNCPPAQLSTGKRLMKFLFMLSLYFFIVSVFPRLLSRIGVGNWENHGNHVFSKIFSQVGLCWCLPIAGPALL